MSKLLPFVGATAICGILSAFPAVAQTAPEAAPAASSMGFEEIVVTARMRNETLQDVPLSETAFTAQNIADARIEGVQDFIALTPNLSIIQSQNVGNAFITIRGISQVRNGESPVAVVVDGVLQVNPNQLTQQMFDLQLIEVLRGPQGALYGRNATGGAILITTKQPTNNFEGSANAGIGRGNEWQLGGTVSGPIVEDKLLFRLGARYSKRDGYFHNTTTGDKVDNYEDFSARGMLKWNVTENLTADVRASVARANGGALNYVFQPAILDANGANSGFDFTKGDANDVTRTFTANNRGYNNRKIDELSLKLDYDADFATFTSISSYNKLNERSLGDMFPYTASANPAYLTDGTQTQYLDVKAWSQEFRITSKADQRLRWMAGAYYLDTKRFLSSTTGDDLGLGIVQVERHPLFDSTINPTATFFADDNHNKAWAVFGNVAYDITDTLEASVAVRYDKDNRTQVVSAEQFSGLPGVGVPGSVNKASFDKWQPKVTLRYHPLDNFQIYGSWGQGFRSGQFNQNGVGIIAGLNGLAGVSDIVPQENTETWELGSKTELLDGRLRLNGSVFHTKVQGQQYFVFVGAVGAQVLVSIDEVELYGAELEAMYRVAEGLDVFGGVGYTHSKIKDYAIDPTLVGNKAPYVPEYSVNLGAQYRVPLTSSVGLFNRVDYQRIGKQYWDPENSTARKPVDLVNLRVGVEDNDGKWSLIGSIENLFDKEYNSEYVSGGFAHAALPRVWRLDVKYNF
ncbi:TonB-dependent receptor [Govanella unica]|uniref:TonB-dependent receptor n=1 Tax=Govanella unica TaxID=2975056 RepID=A0A9X3TYK1_9PROT|nr:TonB-dependent receptor [Govania unica]MDA5194156.1 TonB-dependent receptor [Govania unica]